MKLSIIIVNYNVKHFLVQCLNSVKTAIDFFNQPVEVIVVDNHSVDGSCAVVKNLFSWVKLIENKENVGFSRANNQAIQIAQGEYVLLLNPDTVVEQDTLQKVVSFMDEHPEAGGLGVRMIDGKGKFLPESKRGLPTPMVAFFKISGLSKLFPRSKLFNRYHLGYLDPEKIHEVEVLSGAFMLIRKSVLDKIGLLDETFFMYGEDIDLSYRITLAGYKNYYYPYTTIIHYKGESTKKGSINYVKMFYSAMAIFANKHFRTKQSNVISFIINVAIWFRAFLSILKRFFINICKPAIDFLVSYFVFYGITLFWESIKFHGQNEYPPQFIMFVLPTYALLVVISFLYFGVYQQRPRWNSLFKGLSVASLLLLSLYALLSENLRFSRAIVLIGIASIWIILPTLKYLLKLTGLKLFEIGSPKKKNALFIGSIDELNKVKQALIASNHYQDIYCVDLKNKEQSNDAAYIGTVNDIDEIIQIHKINEIIFSSRELSHKEIIEKMTYYSQFRLDYKIVGDSIIGSKTVLTDEPALDVLVNSIVQPINKRNKRLFDFITAIVLLIFSPIMIFFVNKKRKFLKNCLDVIIGKKTWVGYIQPVSISLPKLKNNILPISNDFVNAEKINLLYANDYKLINDFICLIKNLRNLGN